ncbi:helix-turn-helix transcriptional regulator [Flavobacterium sp. AG291]|uniref:helix-turn-helix transcriptional regulator n=1 Tax=Flavobacterium sp. AG291 TaxID=2184000 RepID=UPI000E0CAE77|nr:helix-turn-helix transcriptional regulator [Flavobacterium sp. AG291]RDI07070.1 transcriptional regulator with XRE-family HTH domain [Flavobacterium sp. AG291]
MDNFIGLNIKYLCDKNLLSQKDFGEIFGITQAGINTYTSGRSNPSVENIQKICKHFAITLDSFINEDLSKITNNETTTKSDSFVEPQPGGIYGDKDKIIEAQAETIETQKKHINTLEKLVETLEEKLSQAS